MLRHCAACDGFAVGPCRSYETLAFIWVEPSETTRAVDAKFDVASITTHSEDVALASLVVLTNPFPPHATMATKPVCSPQPE